MLCLLFCNFRQGIDVSSAPAAEPQASSTQYHPENSHRSDWTRVHGVGALHGCVCRPHGAAGALRGRREAAGQVRAQFQLMRLVLLSFVASDYPLYIVCF